jgi:hypothetical protein
MGQGICGGIQLDFEIEDYEIKRYGKYFPPTYFDFYTNKTKSLYTIKPKMFLSYYGDLLIEFNNIIGEDLSQTGVTAESELLKISNYKQFKEAFSYSNRNGEVPVIMDSAVSFVVCETRSAWVFYLGSYKAYLEEYSTLIHFERVLAQTMKNPLAPIIRLGIIG